MLTEEERRRAAEDILRAETERKAIPQLSRTFPNMEIEDAYRVQDLWAEARIAKGARMVGHKIGLTSRAMQMASKMTEPDYGLHPRRRPLQRRRPDPRRRLFEAAARGRTGLHHGRGFGGTGRPHLRRDARHRVRRAGAGDHRLPHRGSTRDRRHHRRQCRVRRDRGRRAHDPADGCRYPLGRGDPVEERHHRRIRCLGRHHGPSGGRHRLACQQAARR